MSGEHSFAVGVELFGDNANGLLLNIVSFRTRKRVEDLGLAVSLDSPPHSGRAYSDIRIIGKF
jgi:hypothetical protein